MGSLSRQDGGCNLRWGVGIDGLYSDEGGWKDKWMMEHLDLGALVYLIFV